MQNRHSDVSKYLAEAIGGVAYDIWKEQTFRYLIEFEKLSQSEQDRIFNELEVTLLGLLYLNIEQHSSLIDLQKYLTKGFLEQLSSLGIENKFLKDWETLINLRLKEYQEDYAIALEEAKDYKELKDNESLIYIWARVETLTLDCLRHIRRGKLEEKGALWKYLRKILTAVDVSFTKILQSPTFKKLAKKDFIN